MKKDAERRVKMPSEEKAPLKPSKWGSRRKLVISQSWAHSVPFDVGGRAGPKKSSCRVETGRVGTEIADCGIHCTGRGWFLGGIFLDSVDRTSGATC